MTQAPLLEAGAPSVGVVLIGVISVPVLMLHQIMLDGMILGVGAALHPGQFLHAELHHPSFKRPMRCQVRVGWSRPFGASHFVAGMEFVGPWETLLIQRRALGPVLGSVANAPGGPQGFALRAPREVVCTDPYTVRVAVIALDPTGLIVHRRDGQSFRAADFASAISMAFSADAVWLTPPLPGLGAGTPPAPPPPSPPSGDDNEEDLLGGLPDQAQGVVTEEDAILGMNTMIVGPERLDVTPAASAGEDELLAMNTIVLPPERLTPAPGEVEEQVRVSAPGSVNAIEDMRTVVVPAERLAVGGKDLNRSRVLHADTVSIRPSNTKQGPQASLLHAGKVVGYVVPAGLPDSWSVFDSTGTKIAMVAGDGDCARVCYMGTKANADLSFLEAPTVPEALALALDLPSPPRVDPPQAGIS